jgi:hypothetical protein
LRLRHPASARSAATVVAMIAVFGLVAAGCSKSSTPSETASNPATNPTTSGSVSPTTCADLETLKTSLSDLTKINPLQQGLDALNAQVAIVKTNLATVAASASADLQPQVAAVQTAFSGLQTALSGVTSSSLAQSAPAIAAALIQVGTASAALSTTLSQRCPGS